MARVERLPTSDRFERVEDEWSFAETLRHLVFATDAWVGSAILEQPEPYHRFGVTHSSYPQPDAAAIGIDITAQPSFAEVLEARADRVALVRGLVDSLADSDLERERTRPPAPGYPVETRSVGGCLQVVFNEECEHHRYAVRDLAVLEERHKGGRPGS
jgi:hypothetical protein